MRGTTGAKGRRAIAAACVGNAAEWYDFAIYGALATVIGFAFFPAEDLSAALTAAFAVYGTALIVRPLGALVFGRLGDTRGRRGVLVAVILFMTTATAGIGLLPGYAAIGLLAPILVVLLRAAQGFAAGGELGVAAVFMLEHAGHSRRGQAASWQTATMALGIGTGMGVAGFLAFLLGDSERWTGWWRITFLLALPFGLIGFHIRRRVGETQQFVALRGTSKIVDHPVRDLWHVHRAAVLRGFCLVAAGSLAFNTFFIFMPNNLIARHGANLSQTLLATAAALAAMAVAAVALGRASDRLGRRPIALTSSAALVVLAVPASVVATRGSILGLVLAQVLIGTAVGGVLSVAMLGESFPAPVRSTGIALTAGIATALIGGTAPWIAHAFVRVTGAEAVPGVYVAAVGIVAVVALRQWPETAFRELA